MIVYAVQQALNEQDISQLKKLCMDSYRKIIKNVNKQHDEDMLQFCRKFNSNLTYEVHKTECKEETNETSNKFESIRNKWNNYGQEKQIHIYCDFDIKDCVCINRMNYLLQLFDKYRIDQTEFDFIKIYNHCLNDKHQYPVYRMYNDCHHIQKYHQSPGIKECMNSDCKLEDVMGQDNPDFGYKEPQEINIIKMHITFRHPKSFHSSMHSQQFVSSPMPTTSLPTILSQVEQDSVNINRIPSSPTSLFPRQFSRSLSRSYSLQSLAVLPEDAESDDTDRKFSFGIPFYYFQHFKTRPGCIEKPRYKNLKEELLNNKIYKLNHETYANFFEQASKSAISEIGRKIKCKQFGLENKYYEMPPKSAITKSHLLCVSLYTNHNELQRKFKKYGTRYNETANNLTKLKIWNAEIGWWYIHLYQAVMFYGTNCKKGDKFYHGISLKMMFPSFNPKFYAPISTTTSITIAQQFSESGVILELIPMSGSHDRYFNVEWLSDYVHEKERLFCVATDLFVQDIRYGIDQTQTNCDHIAAIRLFDYIFNKCSHCPKEISEDKIQQLLIEYLQSPLTKMDRILQWSEENDLQQLGYYLKEEEYDTDCVDMDISDGYQRSNVYQPMKAISDDAIQKLEYLRSLLDETEIPKYLRQLFEHIKEQVMAKKHINMIKSQFKRLNQALRLALNKLQDEVKVKYANEYEWVIDDDEFKEYKDLPIGVEMEGNEFQCSLWCFDKDVYGKETEARISIRLSPFITRGNASFPDHCTIGIELKSIDGKEKEEISFDWSLVVPELNYSTVEHHTRNVSVGYFDGVKTFEKSLLQDRDSITIVILVH